MGQGTALGIPGGGTPARTTPWDSGMGKVAGSPYPDRMSFVADDVNPFHHNYLRFEFLHPPRQNDPLKCHPGQRDSIAQRRRGAKGPNPFSQRLSLSARAFFRLSFLCGDYTPHAKSANP